MTRWGDPAAFCVALHKRLLGSLVLFCGDVATAEEITQEALARALERWTRVSQMQSPEAWTYRTAFNLARSSFRRRFLERNATRRAAGAEAIDLPDAAIAIAVRQAVGALPSRQRAAIVARYYAGLSVAETAEALRCAPGTVKALTHKAISRLRSGGLAVDDEEAEADATHS